MSDPCTCSWGAPHGDPCPVEVEEGMAPNRAFVDAMLLEEERFLDEIRRQGAAACMGLILMAEAIRTRPFDPFAIYESLHAHTLSRADSVGFRARDMVNEDGTGLAYITPGPDRSNGDG